MVWIQPLAHFIVRLYCIVPPLVESSMLKDKLLSSNLFYDFDIYRLLLVKVELMMPKEGVMLLLVHFLPTWQGQTDIRFIIEAVVF